MTRKPKQLSIGMFDRRLVLEYADRTADGAGGFTTTWLAIGDLWAFVETRSGSETLDTGGVKSRLVHDITVRSRTDIVPSRRFREGSRVFEIQTVQPVGPSRARLLCRCEERNL